MTVTAETTGVLADIKAERARQVALWGVHDWLDGTGTPEQMIALARARIAYAEVFPPGGDWSMGTWWAILTEEYAEVGVETDPDRLYAELVQLAASAGQWAEAIKRRTIAAGFQ